MAENDDRNNHTDDIKDDVVQNKGDFDVEDFDFVVVDDATSSISTLIKLTSSTSTLANLTMLSALCS